MSERDEWIESRRERYAYEFLCPHQELPRGVKGNFIWDPSPDGTTARYFFDSKRDRDAFAASFKQKKAA